VAVIRRLSLAVASVATPTLSAAQAQGCASVVPVLLGAQTTFIGQRLAPFRSPYTGPMSLRADGDRQLSESYGVYAGACLPAGFAVYLDVEMIRGDGISRASGLAGVTNGDVIRQGSADLGDAPYVARAFVRWTQAFGGAERDTIARAMDDLPRIAPARRLEIAAGKLAATDLFDLNRYANSTRTQFLDWALFQNTAWDYAADTRGYTNGLAVTWNTPSWMLRAGSFQMPTAANGNRFDSDVTNARGDNLELTVRAPHGAIVRAVAYVNHARMGRYAVANAAGVAQRRPPDVVADDAPGRTKYGFGLNAELPLADRGETGMFARLGWSDGRNESFAFTEADAHASAGLQLTGSWWGRGNDRVGIAVVADALSGPHRDYLAAGGRGFLLGDGALRYGEELIAEAYYRLQLGPYVQLSPDLLLATHPGYNRDRGPAVVMTLRFNARY
jgi:high affinity Mn2+ porin